MPLRRRATFNSLPSVARDSPVAHPKTLELENRLAKLEILYRDLRAAYDDQKRATAALRAEIDHLRAKLALTP
ncbi:MAG TPA: hypothetical protein VFA59_11225 [Vicinamibacterales bacterium]|nr:hypothetical protein [Vicinamibacterales bacterium]